MVRIATSAIGLLGIGVSKAIQCIGIAAANSKYFGRFKDSRNQARCT